MTGQELMMSALDLCGLLNDKGNTTTDTSDLQQRALTLINITLAENAVLDCRIRKTEHTVPRIRNLEDIIDCCDIVCLRVLPYGVARLMMLGEDDELALSFGNLYSEAREEALRFGKAKVGSITEVYG